MKKFLKVILYIFGGLLLITLGLAIILWIKSPGEADPIVDANGQVVEGSISTIEKIELGGIDQYLIIRGADSTKPVMLYLHGGPGSPEIAFLKETNTAIEQDYVMVYWEQRGSGKSYSSDIPEESMNLQQFIADTKELSELLIKRFKKEKIYLMGHSWGSFLGIATAYQHPELFYSYFGIGQVCDQYTAERLNLMWTKEQARLNNDKDALEELSALTFPAHEADIDDWLDFLMTNRSYTGQYGGGVTRELKGMWPVIKMVLDAKEYTFSDKMGFMSGSLNSLKKLWPTIVETNLFTEIDSMRVPVYIFQGKYDYQTPHKLAKNFYELLKAPKKAFYTFENSAHSPNMEEVERFNGLVKELTE